MRLLNTLVGALLILLSLIVSILDNDFTSTLLFIPLGILLIFSKTNWIK